jgi:hypothetical protein
MSILRAVVTLIVAASVSLGATPEATVSARQYKRGEPRSCELAIVAVDGHRLKSPRTQVRFPSGRHVLTVQVTFLQGKSRAVATVVAADASLVQEFEAHRYTIEGQLVYSGKLTLRVDDEEKKRDESRSRKQHG